MNLQINPDAVKSAGPLIYAFARRYKAKKRCSRRYYRAVHDYMSNNPDPEIYKALGGRLMFNHIQEELAKASDEQTHVMGPHDIFVLGLPYGGPEGGKDSDGQFFSPMTDFMDDLIEFPPVMYTHGTQNGFEPEPVGKATKRWYDARGGWFKVTLDPESPRYEQLREANALGVLRASSGVVPASFSVSPNGHIDTWLAGELSLVDMRDGFKPINGYAITKAEAILFEDYYGAPVEEKMPTIVDVLKEHFNAIIDAVVRHEVDEGEDDYYEYNSGPYYKASGANDVDFGGKKRSKLKKSDFIFPDEQAFPVVTCDDARDAINSWGRYKGEHSFEEFKRRLTARMNKLNCPLPEKWQTEKAEPMTEKCETCEEAQRLADALKAELTAEPKKCARCPEAINAIRGWVKAGKVAPSEAFTLIDRFVESDDGFDELKSEVEARTVVTQAKAKAEPVYIAGGQGQPSTDDLFAPVDEAHMNRQRKLVGLPVK